MNYQDAIRFLYGLQVFGIKLGLRNISSVLRDLGHPQDSIPAIHIAGTNGKGSTAAIIESILRQAGYKTGLFTSPHLFDFTERIRVDGRPVKKRRVSQGIEVLRPYVEKYRCTFFEAATALAFQIFHREAVDIAVVEVGMGGRLDATNVVSPVCTVITDIDHDHSEYLGRTLKEIAREKAAIIKDGNTVVTSVDNPEVVDVLRTVCSKNNARLYTTRESCQVTEKRITFNESRIDARTPRRSYANLRLHLAGRHQIANLRAALLTVDLLHEKGFPVAKKHVTEGVAGAVWPGRLQILRERPLFIVDGAHNPGGMNALRKYMEEFVTFRHLYLILGMMGNKKYADMIRIIAPLAHHIIVTRASTDRALDSHSLKEEVLKYSGAVESIPSVTRAVNRALDLAGPEDAVCAAGSLFLAGDILKKRIGDVNRLFGFD